MCIQHFSIAGTNSTTDFPPLTGLRDLVARISIEWDYSLSGAQGETTRQTWLDDLLDPFWAVHRTSATSVAPTSTGSGSPKFALQDLKNGSMALSVRISFL